MTVLITGSRNWPTPLLILEQLRTHQPTHIIHGGARGVDYFAGLAARKLGIPQTVIRADWDTLGRSAGIQRNLQMLDMQPDAVWAFWDGHSPGTKHCFTAALSRGLPVTVWKPDGTTHIRPETPKAPSWEP